MKVALVFLLFAAFNVKKIGRQRYDARAPIWTSLDQRYIQVSESYTESGAGAFSLDVDRQTTESLQGNIGGKLYYRWETGNKVIMPGINASYGHEFLRGTTDIVSRLAQGSSPFRIETNSPDRDFLLCGAGVSMFTSNKASFHVGYSDVQIGENQYIVHGISGVASFLF